jgi:hypothetical protein
VPASRVQWKANPGQADPATAVLDTTPVSGNLLVAFVSERSGTSHSAFAMDLTNLGWTKAFGVDTELANTTYRRSMAVFWKVAMAAEATGITIDNGTTNVKRILVQEFAAGDGRTFGSLVSAGNHNGAVSNATSVSTGTTPSTSGAHLVIGFLFVKRGNSTATYTTSWSNSLATPIDAIQATSNTQDLCSAFADTAVTGGKESTVTMTATASNVGLTGGILAVEMTGGSLPPASALRPQVVSQAVNRAASF